MIKQLIFYFGLLFSSWNSWHEPSFVTSIGKKFQGTDLTSTEAPPKPPKELKMKIHKPKYKQKTSYNQQVWD